MDDGGLKVHINETTGRTESVTLYGRELLDRDNPAPSELTVNGVPLELRVHHKEVFGRIDRLALKGERWVNHFTGWALTLVREQGSRDTLRHNAFGVNWFVRREEADPTCPIPGPGGPALEAPLYIDSLRVMNWAWKFWGEDTRMIFPTLHSNGPTEEDGHVGFEHGTPEEVKRFLVNDWRRIYPGVLGIQGSLCYDRKTGHWIALVCRDAHLNYVLDTEGAGRGFAYDFRLHGTLDMNQGIRLPEVKVYWGPDEASRRAWEADHFTLRLNTPPEWVYKTVWTRGLVWNNQPTWKEQGDFWMQRLADGQCTGVKYNLVTDRALDSDTVPTSYRPDPNHGPVKDFVRACRRVADAGHPLLIWMSNTGLVPGGLDVDDDWFVRGIDGKTHASWGNQYGGMWAVNPGHPGYIDYTKKWIKFYVKECGAKGIFMDCLGWAFPADFRPRSFMRWPADLNLMTLKFAEEINAYLKELDPEAILIGEGINTDFPVDVMTLYANPVRSSDGQGIRDYVLGLNGSGVPPISVDQGPWYCPASNFPCRIEPAGYEAKNRALVELIRATPGGTRDFRYLTGDLSLLGDRLVVPQPDDLTLNRPFRIDDVPGARVLTDTLDGAEFRSDASGQFSQVPAGIYRIGG